MKKADIGIYILTGLCIVSIVVSNWLKTDTALIVPVLWALLGAVLGRNLEGITLGAKRIVTKPMRKKK